MADGDGLAVPLQRFEFSSDDEGETEEFIQEMYGRGRTRFLGAGDELEWRSTEAVGEVVSAGRVRSMVDYSVMWEPFDQFVFMSVRSGHLDFRWNGGEAVLGAGGQTFYPLGVDIDARARDVDVWTVRLPAQRLSAVAREIVGSSSGDLSFQAVTPVSAEMARQWDAVMTLANTTVLDNDSVVAHPLLAEELTRTIAVTALHTFPNSSMTRHTVPRRSAVGSPALRRAVAHIEDNAHLPLTLSDIAAAAGTTGRALQYAFARHHDTTPMGYLRRVRLEYAHRELRSADPSHGATVLAIARRWGFANSSRFAAYYRATYQQAPSTTLHS